MYSRLGSLIRAGHPVRCARVTRTQLNIEALEARLVPALVSPGAFWDDGSTNSYGVKSGVTVTLQNKGSTWLSVSGGSGTVAVAPGAPPSVASQPGLTISSETPMDWANSSTMTTPVIPAYAFSVVGFQGDGSGDVSWSGAAESLYISATGDISDISIGGDVYVQSGWTVGDITGYTVTAHSGQTIGNVNASGDIGELWADTSIGTVSAGGNIARISAGTTTSDVKAGGWLGTVNAGLDIGGSVKAGLWIGGAYLPEAGPENYLAWQYASYGSGVSAGRDVSGSVSAGKGIVGVKAGRHVLGSIFAAGGDIGWVLSNSQEFIAFYSSALKERGITNIVFKLISWN
jgi:hypothetical protein